MLFPSGGQEGLPFTDELFHFGLAPTQVSLVPVFGNLMFFRALIEISNLEAMGTESNHFQFADLIKGLRVVWWIAGRNSSFHILSFRVRQTFPSKSMN